MELFNTQASGLSNYTEYFYSIGSNCWDIVKLSKKINDVFWLSRIFLKATSGQKPALQILDTIASLRVTLYIFFL